MVLSRCLFESKDNFAGRIRHAILTLYELCSYIVYPNHRNLKIWSDEQFGVPKLHDKLIFVSEKIRIIGKSE